MSGRHGGPDFAAPARRRSRGGGPFRLAVLGAVLALCAGALVVAVQLTQQESAPSGPSSQAAPGKQGGVRPAARDRPLPASDPARISIPSLKVASSLERLGRNAKGAMETPRDPARAGWYTPGPSPGSQGPSVIAGHVSWNGKPSVFHRLGSVRSGDRVEVARKDGRTAVFSVDRVARYSKARFPTAKVYGNVDHAGLRLITCGGDYDRATHRYADNVVVYASLSATRG